MTPVVQPTKEITGVGCGRGMSSALGSGSKPPDEMSELERLQSILL